MQDSYDRRAIEAKARSDWRMQGYSQASEDRSKERFFCLAMFPYPSGSMHIGHVRCYTLSDVIARYQRLCGKNVLHPIGWDAFGLPAENAAIQRSVAAGRWTKENIDNMRGQLQALGISFDWRRELTTCEPGYYRWEQWLFSRMFAHGLVYRESAMVNWDPVDRTVLANEQVVNGRGWRSDAPVERRRLAQWFFRITAYAEELLADLDRLPGWPERIKTMQRNWIGRSEGLQIRFPLVGSDDPIETYSTRPDTLLGATFLALSPEHPLVLDEIRERPELVHFIEQYRNLKVAEADMSVMEKQGIPLRKRARHPLTGADLPVWVANFVLLEYGSGAIMCVPGHDQRDWEFARKYGLPIVQVVVPDDDGESDCDLQTAAYVDKGRLIHSGEYDGMDFQAASDAIAAALEAKGLGGHRVQYRLRDWSASRQRYWGCPIPIVHCPDCGPVSVPDEELPIRLPENVEFQGMRSPLMTMESFYRCSCPRCGRQACRETDTLDTFVESSWYYARFCCFDNDNAMLDPRAAAWMPVDQYVGGVEHAVLHLLYARFYHKVMRDLDIANAPLGDEPFRNLLLIGMVLMDGKKMSKSAGSKASPQSLIDAWGADALRLAVIFAAPPEQSFEWSEHSVEAAARFLRRLWALTQAFLEAEAGSSAANGPADEPDPNCAETRALRRKAHETLAKVRRDYDRLAFNTVVSAVMDLCNEIRAYMASVSARAPEVREAIEIGVQALSPITPHLCHTLWHLLGHTEPAQEIRWIPVDEEALVRAEIDLVVQVNGKLRGRIRVPADADEAAVRKAALADENVARFATESRLRKVVYVPGRLVNLVVP